MPTTAAAWICVVNRTEDIWSRCLNSTALAWRSGQRLEDVIIGARWDQGTRDPVGDELKSDDDIDPWRAIRCNLPTLDDAGE